MCCIDIIFFIFIFQLMDLAEGRIALVLEGGYNLDSIAKLMHACLEVLLEDKPLVGSSEAYPFESTWRVIQAVITCGPLYGAII
jgi:histone deacetylase 6